MGSSIGDFFKKLFFKKKLQKKEEMIKAAEIANAQDAFVKIQEMGKALEKAKSEALSKQNQQKQSVAAAELKASSKEGVDKWFKAQELAKAQSDSASYKKVKTAKNEKEKNESKNELDKDKPTKPLKQAKLIDS